MESDEKVKRLFKSRKDRMIDGVCGGVAEYIGVDPVLVRIGFLLLVFAGGVGVIAYIIGMILMPAASVPVTPTGGATAFAGGAASVTPGGTAQAASQGTATETSEGTAAAIPGAGASAAPADHLARPGKSTDSTARIIGIGFVVLGGILLLGNIGFDFWHYWWGLSWGSIAPILIIAAGVALVLRSPRAAAAGGAAGGATAGQEGPSGGPGFSPGRAPGSARLYRARADRKFLGVCGGLGVYLSVDPTILRLLFVISAIASFGGTVLLYLITAIIVPAEPLVARIA